VKITDLSVTLFDRDKVGEYQYGPHNAKTTGNACFGLVTISTDEGMEGHAFLGSATRSAELDAFSLVNALKPMIVGQNPLNREFLYKQLCRRFRQTPWRCIGAVDTALWDLGGKIAGLPIYQLIGAYRDSAQAYASSPGYTSPEPYVEEVQRVKELGFAGYKIHPPRVGWRGDVKACEAVRKTIGDDFTLMLDSSWQYNYTEAVRVGLAIEDMDFYWFEDPLAEEDIYNYVKLRQKLRIPLMATEYSPGAFHAYQPWILQQATDYLRGDVAVKGGITACLKIAHLAEAFRMNFEIHHGANSLNNVANLHVMCAIPNSEFFEVILPDEMQKYGIVDDLVVDAKGMVHAPQKPGLGVEIDFDLIRRRTVGTVN
jgi:L-alanine-DL-glutamate epimerase-like enolase superfamily enzyme